MAAALGLLVGLSACSSGGGGNPPAANGPVATPAAPSIVTPPSLQSVTVGDSVTLTVVAAGTAPLSYQWYSGTSSDSVTTPILGATSDFYAPPTTVAGTTYYAVTVSNITGTPATSTPAAVTVSTALMAPTFNAQPAAASVPEGTRTTFSVVATGSGTLHYVWQLRPVAQPGYTDVGTDAATYTVPFPMLADSGASLKVTVYNAVGSITSKAVSLTVTAAPAYTMTDGTTPLALTALPGGTFLMGTPETGPYASEDTSMGDGETPQHQVTLSQGFFMGTYPVTQAQWTVVMGSNPSNFTGDTSCPVEQVSWDMICTSTASPAYTCFLDKLNAYYGLTGASPLVFRLPTEAEWEYACRAGSTGRFFWGDASDSDPTINNYAWYYGNGGTTTMPVGGKLPNAWGLYDMAGNVWEWCQDWWQGNSYTSTAQADPLGPTSGTRRVLRGGSWNDDSPGCRSAFRSFGAPGLQAYIIGFRVVLAPPRTP